MRDGSREFNLRVGCPLGADDDASWLSMWQTMGYQRGIWLQICCCTPSAQYPSSSLTQSHHRASSASSPSRCRPRFGLPGAGLSDASSTSSSTEDGVICTLASESNTSSVSKPTYATPNLCRDTSHKHAGAQKFQNHRTLQNATPTTHTYRCFSHRNSGSVTTATAAASNATSSSQPRMACHNPGRRE